MRLKQRLVTLPPGMDIVEFVEHDGKPAPAATGGEGAGTGQDHADPALRDKYLETHEGVAGALDHLWDEGPLQPLEGASGRLFRRRPAACRPSHYVDRRAKAKGRQNESSPAATIKKEIVTLRTMWNWAVKMKLVAGRFPYDGLRYPRTSEKPPFQTMAEISDT